VIAKALSALIGAEIERGRNASPVKGAVIGVAAGAVLKRLGPIGLVLGGAWAAKRIYDRRKAARHDTPSA
jgi:hypothetical protein